jgi:RNA polymerase sigma-54 factor
MTLGLRLDLRQTQSLVLTPQLQQAIKLLQLSNIELASVVDREVAENPFLSRTDERQDQRPAMSERERELDGAVGLASRRVEPEDGWTPPLGGSGADQRLRVSKTSTSSFDETDQGFDGRLSRPKTLADHLREQLASIAAAGATQPIARVLVDFIDEEGYLREPDEALAAQLGVPTDAVRLARAALQRCEPTGVGARDLAECLALQVAERDRLDPAMRTLLANLPLVARADFSTLQRLCRVDLDDVRDMITELKQLDPRPGLSFAPAEPIEAIPDVVVRRSSDGNWRIELNEATLPRIMVDRSYYADVSGPSVNRRDREFMSERYQAASWLIKALDQRSKTLLRVAQAIFERQVGFLASGPHDLRPLVLRDIAEVTGLHESTVSRATADKFAATPRGTFPLRYFFTTAIAGTCGEETFSAEAIRQQIRRMIDGEDAVNVLSDDQIVEALKGMGVAIARRTVAKYRESLGIPSSVQRRRSKALIS